VAGISDSGSKDGETGRARRSALATSAWAAATVSVLAVVLGFLLATDPHRSDRAEPIPATSGSSAEGTATPLGPTQADGEQSPNDDRVAMARARAGAKHWSAPFPIDLLSSVPQQPGEQFLLRVPGEDPLPLEIVRVQSPRSGSRVITGRLVGPESGYFSIASVDGQVAGVIQRYDSHEVVNLRPAANGEVHYHRQHAHELGDCAGCQVAQTVARQAAVSDQPRLPIELN